MALIGSTSSSERTTIRSGVTKSDVGLGSVDNDSTATIRSGTTKSNVGLGSVEDTALSTWAGSTNLITIGRLTSDLKVTGAHIYGTDWYNHGGTGGSDIYLRTPIVQNEGNMFNIEVLSYEYGASYAGSYMFGAYAYGAGGMISTRMTTIHGRGISMGVSNNKIWCRINGGAGYYNHYCFRYHGWQNHDNSGFSWGNSA